MRARRELEFEAAIRTGVLVQGDTLLHVACRKANRRLVEILLAAGSPEECRNYKMKKPIEVAGDPKIRQELDDLTLVHRIGSVKMKGKGLALDLVRVGRQLFPAWCYNNSWEGGVLLRAISGIKAGVKSFGTMPVRSPHLRKKKQKNAAHHADKKKT